MKRQSKRNAIFHDKQIGPKSLSSRGIRLLAAVLCVCDCEKKLYFIYSNRNIATKEALKTTEMDSNNKKHKSERREKYEGNY